MRRINTEGGDKFRNNILVTCMTEISNFSLIRWGHSYVNCGSSGQSNQWKWRQIHITESFRHQQNLPRKRNMINRILNINQLIKTTTVKFNRLNFMHQNQQFKSIYPEMNFSINATIHQSESPAYGNQHTLIKCTGTKIYKTYMIYQQRNIMVPLLWSWNTLS